MRNLLRRILSAFRPRIEPRRLEITPVGSFDPHQHGPMTDAQRERVRALMQARREARWN